MSIVSKLAKTARAKITAGSKVALSKGGDAFNKLDELGGEARDTIKVWWDESPAMGSVRDMLRKRAGDDDQTDEESDPNISDAEIIETPTPGEPAGLGDNTVAVQVFGKRSCPWSGRAIRLLEDAEIEHTFVDLDDSENASLSSQLVAETKHNTVPYIYIRGEFIGGFNALDEVYRLGQLEVRVNETSDKTGRVVVEVAQRPNTDEVAPAEGHSIDDTDPPADS